MAHITLPQATAAGQVGPSLRERQRAHAWLTLGGAGLGLVAGFVAAPWLGVTALDVGLLVVMYALTMTGVAVGLHLLFGHRAFVAGRAVRGALGVLGSMAGQGPLVYWATNHRLHHAHSDGEGDLHSPWVDSRGRPTSGLHGLAHAHFGWVFDHAPANPLRYAKDLLRDPVLTWVNAHYAWWVLLGLVLPTAVGFGLGGARGLWSGFVWGGLLRMCLVQHATFAGNSLCHRFGVQPYRTQDRSTNVWWLTLPTWGGAMHNTHHAFPGSAVIGARWWHFDVAGWLILGLRRLGLATSVNVVSPAQRERFNEGRGA